MRENEVTKVLGKGVKSVLEANEIPFDKLQEIRLRIGKPLIVIANNIEWVMSKVIEKEEFTETLEYISNYSLYAFENELKQGFITI